MITLVDSEINSFLIISGQIREAKRNEFEQTFRLAASSMSGGCIVRNLSRDANKEGYYHFFSLWVDESCAEKIY